MAQQLKSRSDPIKKYGSNAAWLLSEAEELKCLRFVMRIPDKG